ncbi:MAG: hypothetical protein S4CHLAM102_09140 [Chlamydiia bacterium]|nr:hypothetical protein [Chlamydiia bacterium]
MSQGRSYYNYYLYNQDIALADHVPTWVFEDYRALKEEELFARLEEVGVFIDAENFIQFAMDSDSPESLALSAVDEEEDEEIEQRIYPLFFEIWRRLLPEKQTVSIFCDELDFLIDRYEQNLDDEQVAEKIFDALELLGDILDENCAETNSQQQVFAMISGFVSHHLEEFIYSFVRDQIEKENRTAASELIDAFKPYIQDRAWFDYLTSRLVLESDPKEGRVMLERLFETLDEEPNLELAFEILDFVISKGGESLFIDFFLQTLDQIETEKDFIEMLRLAESYYLFAGQREKREAVDAMVAARVGYDPEVAISQTDLDWITIREAFSAKQTAD